ncbi:MAG: HK97 family phage prohead protease [Alphaproteobacteria bacterium]|nr:HK97 family phage prohead protease [Alphaproteobacteria bacterium]
MAVRDLEQRRFAEVRAAGRRLEGYAALFASEARIGDFVEVIAPGAFRASLAGDVLALQDHAFDKVLGRTQSGTLRLSEDAKGLAFSLDLPDTTPGRDVLTLAERGDLGGMSFGFQLPDGGDTWQGNRRTLRAVNLMEISVVSAWPAYPDTAAELALRSRRQDTGTDRRTRALILAKAGGCA